MISRIVWRCSRFSHTLCSSEQPSTSKDNCRNEAQSYVDSIKSYFPMELEALNIKLARSQELRMKLKMPDVSKFLSLMNTSVLSDKCTLVPVGSTVNGLYCGSSDSDFVFVPNSEYRSAFLREFHKSLGFRNQFMFSLSKLIDRKVKEINLSVTSSSIIPKGRVPLLSLCLSDDTKVDIQFSEENFHAIRNTQLILMYTKCDERFVLLYIWLRQLALSLQILNSKIGALASYHLVLLIVHFLQSEKCLTPWPVLPVLGLTHPNLVGKNNNIDDIISSLRNPCDHIKWKSFNKMSPSELIIRFVDYYSTFSPSESAIYIDTGRTLRRKHVSDPNCMQLFDPYSRLSVCRSPYASFAFVEAMNFVKKNFKKGDMITSFPDFAEEAEVFLFDTKWRHWRVHMEEMKKML